MSKTIITWTPSLRLQQFSTITNTNKNTSWILRRNKRSGSRVDIICIQTASTGNSEDDAGDKETRRHRQEITTLIMMIKWDFSRNLYVDNHLLMHIQPTYYLHTKTNITCSQTETNMNIKSVHWYTVTICNISTCSHPQLKCKKVLLK